MSIFMNMSIKAKLLSGFFFVIIILSIVGIISITSINTSLNVEERTQNDNFSGHGAYHSLVWQIQCCT